MNNILQYLNHNKPCNRNIPTIDTSKIVLPTKVSDYLIYDNFLSEFETDAEKKRVMLNILLFDSIPTENSTKLLSSGTIYESLTGLNIITTYIRNTLINILEEKADKSELFDGRYQSLTGKPTKLSDFTNDVGFVTLSYLTSNYRNINWLTENFYYKDEIENIIGHYYDIYLIKNNYYDKNEVDNIINHLPTSHTELYEYIDQLINELKGIKHEFLTQAEYDALESYDKDTLYFIVEKSIRGSVFGDTFPFILS